MISDDLTLNQSEKNFTTPLWVPDYFTNQDMHPRLGLPPPAEPSQGNPVLEDPAVPDESTMSAE